jgi:hypothetical protein
MRKTQRKKATNLHLLIVHFVQETACFGQIAILLTAVSLFLQLLG